MPNDLSIEELETLKEKLFKDPASLNVLNEVYKTKSRCVDKTSLLTEISSVDGAEIYDEIKVQAEKLKPFDKGENADFYVTNRIERKIDDLKDLGLILEESNTLMQTEKGLGFFNYLMQG